MEPTATPIPVESIIEGMQVIDSRLSMMFNLQSAMFNFFLFAMGFILAYIVISLIAKGVQQ